MLLFAVQFSCKQTPPPPPISEDKKEIVDSTPVKPALVETECTDLNQGPYGNSVSENIIQGDSLHKIIVGEYKYYYKSRFQHYAKFSIDSFEQKFDSGKALVVITATIPDSTHRKNTKISISSSADQNYQELKDKNCNGELALFEITYQQYQDSVIGIRTSRKEASFIYIAMCEDAKKHKIYCWIFPNPNNKGDGEVGAGIGARIPK
jgi:hypothetical protein